MCHHSVMQSQILKDRVCNHGAEPVCDFGLCGNVKITLWGFTDALNAESVGMGRH